MNSPHRLLDPRSGLVLDTHELGRRAGAMREVHQVADAPDDLGIDMAAVPPGSPIDLDLRLESVVDGILVTGVAEMTVVGECARCLDRVEEHLESDIQELYLYPGAEADDEEAHRVQGDLIDLEPVLRDAVVLELPFSPLCRPDCAGLCPECGARLNDDPDHHHGERLDPRWGSLSAWHEQTS